MNSFVDFILNLVVSLDKALIVRDFDIHFDNSEAPLKTVAVSIQDLQGVNQITIGSTYNGGPTLYLILIFILNIETYSPIFTV